MDCPPVAPLRARRRPALLALTAAALAAGCGSARPVATPTNDSGGSGSGIPANLLREARPIGRGPRFHPPARGSLVGPCRRALGHRDAVHVELFAAGRVVVIAAGIGVRGPVTHSAGRIVAAGCFGSPATVEPTGVVLMRPTDHSTLGTLFRAWGQALTDTRVASFTTDARRPVRIYVAGRRVSEAPQAVPLRRHGEVVVEVGPYVPPHTSYTFPPGL